MRKVEVFLVVHVDNILVSTHAQPAIEQFIAEISKHFAIKDLEEVSYYHSYASTSHTTRRCVCLSSTSTSASRLSRDALRP